MTEKSYIDSKGQEFFLNANGIVLKEGAEGNSINDFEVITAKAFIKTCCKKLRQKNMRNTSYGLKTSAGKWGKEMNELVGKEFFAKYVSNGAFIKGAIDLGFMIHRIERSYNCIFNMSVKR